MIEGLKFKAAEIAELAPLVSIIVPVLNEQKGIAPFIAALDTVIAQDWADDMIKPRFEIIFVDDGSTDHTAQVIRECCYRDNRIKLVMLSRNFGKEAALSAGLKASAGNAVIPMDVDLQDPPELLRPMIDMWHSGVQVVNAKRCDRSSDTLFKRLSSKLFYKAINLFSDRPIAEDVGDFRLFDRVAVDSLNRLTEASRFNKGLFSWIGFRTETLEYVRPARSVGDTKWNMLKLVGLALDGIISSTTFPLRIWTGVGAAISALSFCYASYLVIHTVVYGVETPGYASIMAVVLCLGGLNLLGLGLMGEYVGRIAKQVRNRPLYIISDTEGF